MIQHDRLRSSNTSVQRLSSSPSFQGQSDSINVAIGTDEWVAQIDRRRERRSGILARAANGWESIPSQIRYALFLAAAILFPLLTNSDLILQGLGLTDNSFILRTAIRFFTFALLGMGLTIVVGYAGLLDLGYIAFMGIAGYLYAYLSSDFMQIPILFPGGLAIPSAISIPAIVLVVAGIGYTIGTISMRLAGDYLAIVTLGFGQVFLQLALTMTRVRIPGHENPIDFTHGPNGIHGLANIDLFGYEFVSTAQYYYLFLLLVALVFAGVNRLNHSQIGRSWRAIREDELAAEAMGLPTRRLKLLAFAMGAAIAALAGATDAAFQGNVIPNPRYGMLALISLYAMVVLGGIGRLEGAILGALIFAVLPEALRSITLAGHLFYGSLLLGLLVTIRPWSRLGWVLGGTILGGAMLKLVINALAPGYDSGYPPSGSYLNMVVQSWLVIPGDYVSVGKALTCTAFLMVLAAILLRRSAIYQSIVLGICIYSAAFAWETTLGPNPSATRILVVGLTLVVLMIVRPQGLMGKPEAKVI